MTEPRTPSLTEGHFLQGLRLAVVVISAVVLAGSSIFRNLHRYDPAWLQLVAYAVFVMIVVIEIALIRRRRSWRGLRVPGIAVIVAASIATISSLPHATAVTSTDWAFGTVGWVYLIVVLDRPLRWLVGCMLLHETITVGGVVLSGAADQDVLLNLVSGSIGALGYPIAAGFAATALRAVAVDAETAVRQAEELRTADEVVARLHAHRREKFLDLSTRAVPLLRGIADGSANPADPHVQRACAIEAARMRRLFAEADRVPDALLHELRHSADVADRRGVLVEMQDQGRWPDPPIEVRRAITEAPIAALSTARHYARITVVGGSGGLAVSVVSDGGPITLPEVDHVGVSINSMVDGQMLWVEAQWIPIST